MGMVFPKDIWGKFIDILCDFNPILIKHLWCSHTTSTNYLLFFIWLWGPLRNLIPSGYVYLWFLCWIMQLKLNSLLCCLVHLYEFRPFVHFLQKRQLVVKALLASHLMWKKRIKWKSKPQSAQSRRTGTVL